MQQNQFNFDFCRPKPFEWVGGVRCFLLKNYSDAFPLGSVLISLPRQLGRADFNFSEEKIECKYTQGRLLEQH